MPASAPCPTFAYVCLCASSHKKGRDTHPRPRATAALHTGCAMAASRSMRGIENDCACTAAMPRWSAILLRFMPTPLAMRAPICALAADHRCTDACPTPSATTSLAAGEAPSHTVRPRRQPVAHGFQGGMGAEKVAENLGEPPRVAEHKTSRRRLAGTTHAHESDTKRCFNIGLEELCRIRPTLPKSSISFSR